MGIFNFKGVALPERKASTGIDITPLRPMDFYSVPLKLKGISESEPVVSVGEEVKEGTLIAKPAGNFGLNIYSPVSGKVLNIFDKITADGFFCKHILIMNDGKNESVDLPDIGSVSDTTLITRLKEAGLIDTISNLPTYLKYAYTGSRTYKTLIVLMDSTDPTNSVNETLAQYKTEEVINGAKYFMNITNAHHITFVFTEKNRKLADMLKKHIADTKKNYDYKIKIIPYRYPYDNPYTLTKSVIGKRVSAKTSFLELGVTIETAEACYNFCRAVEFNKPVTHKIVTVDGDNVVRKGNFSVANGVSFDALIDFATIEDKESQMKIIDGSLLSGKAQYNTDISISLSTNTILLLKFNEYAEGKEFNCISCGRCSKVCPMLLNPQRIEAAFLDGDTSELEKLKISSCIECGCCSYVCPSKRFLTQRIIDAKFYGRIKSGGIK